MVATKQHKDSPVVYIDGTSFIHVTCRDIIVVAATKSNVAVGMALEFIYQLLRIMQAYFGAEVD
jgi:AP-2 complex subunit mu-1